MPVACGCPFPFPFTPRSSLPWWTLPGFPELLVEPCEPLEPSAPEATACVVAGGGATRGVADEAGVVAGAAGRVSETDSGGLDPVDVAGGSAVTGGSGVELAETSWTITSFAPDTRPLAAGPGRMGAASLATSTRGARHETNTAGLVLTGACGLARTIGGDAAVRTSP